MADSGKQMQRNAWQRLAIIPTAKISLIVLTLIALTAVFGPLLLPARYFELTKYQFLAPTLAHPFGTGLKGGDVFFRVLEGARLSLLVGVSGALISFFVGTAYGLIAGYAGGRWDSIMMRAVEILYSIPRLIIILIFINAFDMHVKRWLENHGVNLLVSYSRILILVLS